MKEKWLHCGINAFRRPVIRVVDHIFKAVSDDKGYSELELENYRLRAALERLTGRPDYWRV